MPPPLQVDNIFVLIAVRASCGVVYCNRSCLWVCGWFYLWVCYHDNSKLSALESRRIRAQLPMCYKMLHGLVDIDCSSVYYSRYQLVHAAFYNT